MKDYLNVENIWVYNVQDHKVDHSLIGKSLTKKEANEQNWSFLQKLKE